VAHASLDREMPTKSTAEPPFGKPTIETNNHDRNYGQRESSHAIGEQGKPTLEPTTHDSNYGQRDVIDEEEGAIEEEYGRKVAADVADEDDDDADDDDDDDEGYDDLVSRADWGD
jgi:hypothetical protein